MNLWRAGRMDGLSPKDISDGAELRGRVLTLEDMATLSVPTIREFYSAQLAEEPVGAEADIGNSQAG